jgi:hypothetical protein
MKVVEKTVPVHTDSKITLQLLKNQRKHTADRPNQKKVIEMEQ